MPQSESMMAYTYTKLPDSVDPTSVIQLLVSIGWGSDSQYDPAQVKLMFERSSYVIMVEKQEKLIGYLRALSDYVSTTWISEVVVAPDHQKCGVGRALVSQLLKDLGRTAIYVDAIHGSEAFFEKLGIAARPGHLIACSRPPDEREA